MALMGFDDFDNMFGRVDRMMNSMMRNMFGHMQDPFDMMNGMMMHHHQPSRGFGMMGHHPGFGSSALEMFNSGSPSYASYSSSVMTMTTDASGRPQIYQATSSSRTGPGGVKETKSTVRDSRSGLHKMAIGHHIHDRGHVRERSRNYYTGEEEENDEYINMDEDDATAFNHEWKQKINRTYGSSADHTYRSLRHAPEPDVMNQQQQLALPAPPPPPPPRGQSSPTPQQTTSSQQPSRVKFMSKERARKRDKKPYRKN